MPSALIRTTLRASDALKVVLETQPVTHDRVGREVALVGSDA
jgi:hypothetical protein